MGQRLCRQSLEAAGPDGSVRDGVDDLRGVILGVVGGFARCPLPLKGSPLWRAWHETTSDKVRFFTLFVFVTSL